jgi:biotin carboxylase
MGGNRLLILGAGLYQIHSIKKAVELGYEVTTLDYHPDNIGHRYAHHSIDCSTTDREEVLRWARHLGIDGIFSMASDVAMPTLAVVAQELGLRGPPVPATSIMTNKRRFREFQASHRLPCPRFSQCSTLGDALDGSKALGGRIVLKPVDSSGSRGIRYLNTPQRDDIAAAFEVAMRYSRSGQICMDQYVEGDDVSAEGFLVEGEIIFIAFTQKYSRNLVVTGHRVPSSLTPAEWKRAETILRDHFEALGYRNGPFDADLVVTPRSVVLIEISTRLGGNGVPQSISRRTGVDLIEMALRFSMGEDVSRIRRRGGLPGCGSLVIGSARGGRLLDIACEGELQRAVPSVFEAQLRVAPGSSIEAFEHGGNALGYVLFDVESDEEYRRRAEQVHQALRITLET